MNIVPFYMQITKYNLRPTLSGSCMCERGHGILWILRVFLFVNTSNGAPLCMSGPYPSPRLVQVHSMLHFKSLKLRWNGYAKFCIFFTSVRTDIVITVMSDEGMLSYTVPQALSTCVSHVFFKPY